MTTTYYFKASFTKLGVGSVPVIAPLCTVVDSANNILANAQACTALTNLPGVYLYSYTGAAGLDLIGKFSTTDQAVDAQDVYSYFPYPIINVSAAVSATVAAAVSSGTLALESAYTFRQTITSTLVSDLGSATKLWLSIKTGKSDADAVSLIYIEKTAGLTVVAGSAYATTANGSLTVTGSAGAWSVAIHIDEAATALLLGTNGTYPAALKALIAGDAVAVWEGNCIISDGIVRTIA